MPALVNTNSGNCSPVSIISSNKIISILSSNELIIFHCCLNSVDPFWGSPNITTIGGSIETSANSLAATRASPPLFPMPHKKTAFFGPSISRICRCTTSKTDRPACSIKCDTGSPSF